MNIRIGHTLFGGAAAGIVIASGVALCISSADANYEVTRQYKSSTKALATSTGYGFITKSFSGVAHSNCLLTAATIKTKSVESINILAISTSELITIILDGLPMSASAVGSLKGEYVRTVSSYSSVVADSTALGYMQVNDLQKAPESRTYRLLA